MDLINKAIVEAEWKSQNKGKGAKIKALKYAK